MFAENRKLGLETCFHDLMMEVEKPWGVCWGCSAQLLQCEEISLSLSPTELVCDTESDHMMSVVAVFHTDYCCSSSSFAGFNPQLFTRPCNTSASSVMQTLVASEGKTSFITGGVDARRTVRKSSSNTCIDSVTNCVYTRLFLPF